MIELYNLKILKYKAVKIFYPYISHLSISLRIINIYDIQPSFIFRGINYNSNDGKTY